MADIPHEPESELDFARRLATWLATYVDVQSVLDEIVGWVAHRFAGDEGCIRLSTAETPAGQTFIRRDRGSGSWPHDVAISLMGIVANEGTSIATPDLTRDRRFPGLRRSDIHIRSLLAVPMRAEGRIMGVLAVSRREPGHKWSRPDAELLSFVAELSGPIVLRAIERQDAAEREAEQRELEHAKAVQERALPVGPMTFGHWDLAGKIKTARRVGGDLFGYWPLGRDQLAVVVADVEGKGFPAALTMMRLHELLLGQCNGHRSPVEAMRQINQRLVEEDPKQVTLFYAEIDAAKGSMRFIRAGHPYPLLRSNRWLSKLDSGCPPLGILPDVTIEDFEVPFTKNDALFVYSDGIPDATNLLKEFYDIERLEDLLSGVSGSAPENVDRVLADVTAFIGPASQADDMTILAITPTSE